MPSKPRYTCEQLIAALKKTKGMVYLAADELGCSHVTVYNYINRHPSVKAVFKHERGKMLDAAEMKLYTAILDGESWAIQFSLRLLGRDRGYAQTQRQEITGKVKVSLNDVLAGLPGDFGDAVRQALAETLPQK